MKETKGKNKSTEALYEEFYTLVALLDKKDELRKFFEDALTPREMENVHKRILIAFLLEKGYGYEAICGKVQSGMQKVLNVKKALKTGSGGYKFVFERLAKVTVKKEPFRDYPSLTPPFSHPLSIFGMLHSAAKRHSERATETIPK